MHTKSVSFKKLSKRLKAYNNSEYAENKALLNMPDAYVNDIVSIYKCDSYCIDFENSNVNLFYN